MWNYPFQSSFGNIVESYEVVVTGYTVNRFDADLLESFEQILKKN